VFVRQVQEVGVVEQRHIGVVLGMSFGREHTRASGTFELVNIARCLFVVNCTVKLYFGRIYGIVLIQSRYV